MKILSWNVNGLRAVLKKGFAEWFHAQKADMVCLQEIKVKPEQLEEANYFWKGYQPHWYPAEKPGYSGVAIFTKKKPTKVLKGMGIGKFDQEGRVLGLDYGSWVLVNAYFPNSQREHARLPYKLEFCKAIEKFLKNQVKSGKNIVLCGDYNVAHKEIDLRNPKTNRNNAGFLPQERSWMDTFLKKDFVDTFRHFEKGEGHYTWWSYRPGVREKNVGWRIDYFCTNLGFVKRIKKSKILPNVYGSDHCPIELQF
jgi:exodeoxyribonuclease III